MIEGSLSAEFRAYVGALASPEGNDLLRLLPEATRTQVRALLIPVLDPERSCQVIGVLLPKDVRFVGFQYEAADLGARGGCFPDQPCEIGEAQWRGNPVIHRHDHGTLVYGVFENLSPDARREGQPEGLLPAPARMAAAALRRSGTLVPVRTLSIRVPDPRDGLKVTERFSRHGPKDLLRFAEHFGARIVTQLSLANTCARQDVVVTPPRFLRRCREARRT